MNCWKNTLMTESQNICRAEMCPGKKTWATLKCFLLEHDKDFPGDPRPQSGHPSPNWLLSQMVLLQAQRSFREGLFSHDTCTGMSMTGPMPRYHPSEMNKPGENHSKHTNPAEVCMCSHSLCQQPLPQVYHRGKHGNTQEKDSSFSTRTWLSVTYTLTQGFTSPRPKCSTLTHLIICSDAEVWAGW